MESPWKVTRNTIDDKPLHRVYRLINTREADHSGNREYAGSYYSDRKPCERAAEYLNGKNPTSGVWRTDDLTLEQRQTVSEIIHDLNAGGVTP
jgi:hypothetical protein